MTKAGKVSNFLNCESDENMEVDTQAHEISRGCLSCVLSPCFPNFKKKIDFSDKNY